MKKRELKIINFLHLSDEKYNQIREYRNQKFIREVSLNQDIITSKEHNEYKKLLQEKDKFFAFLILSNDKDYSVLSFKKIDGRTYYIGDYLVKEEYKYEGGGVVNRFCTIQICDKLNIQYLKYNIKLTNSRGFRAGAITNIQQSEVKNGIITELARVRDLNDTELNNSKAKILFDKMYKIVEFKN